MHVQFVDFDAESIRNKLIEPHNPRFPVPESVADLEIDPLRIDDYQGGPLGEMIYGPHYYRGRLFYESLPDGGAVVDSVRYYPILDLANRTFSLPDGGRLTFSGRIFGQETASTVYEAVLDSSAEGVCRLVAVKIRDHGEARDREESGITDSKGEIQIEGQRAVMMDAIPGKPGAP